MKDKNGKEVRVGDILIYDECGDPTYGRGIHVVVEENGELFGQMRIGFPAWSEYENDELISLSYYSTNLTCEVIGNLDLNPGLVSCVEARHRFPDTPLEVKDGD